MKNPNGYGAIIRLKGKRRKLYAVRISTGYKQRICVPNKAELLYLVDKYPFTYRKSKNDYVIYIENDEVKSKLDEYNVPYRIEYVRKYKYLEYFKLSKDAHAFLAQYNSGMAVQEHVPIASEPSFKDVFNMYIEFAESLNKPPSLASMRSYKTGYKLWEDVHDIRFRSITTKQLQDCLTAHGTMSKASVTRMITILKKMYKYALANQICDTDLTPYLFAEHTDDKTIVHDIYSDDEIKKLWDTDSEAARVMLILIYTGLRCSEFLELKTENIHLDERYLVGGKKTDAGKNRKVPIHKKLIPVIEYFYNPKNKYLYPNADGSVMLYSHFRENKWENFKLELGMDHYTHDCRHTCATKLEKYGVSDLHRKLILGHSVRDVTDGVYTHIQIEDLIKDIDKWK